MSINVVVISGNLTREPELRQTPSGYMILNIGVAVNDRRKNQQTGEWEDYANFVDCVIFGNRAESLSKILHKGSKVTIDGKLRYSSWDDKDGHKRSKLEVIADDVDLAPRGQQQGQQQGGYAPQPPAMQGQYQQPPAQQPPMQQPQYQQPPMQQPPMQPQYQQPPAQQGGFYDEDIPF